MKATFSFKILLSILFIFNFCIDFESAVGQRPSYLQKDSIISQMDGVSDVFYFDKSAESSPQPLIVELHTWSFSSTSQTELTAQEVHAKKWNYILPNFRGVNNTVKACCSEFATSDIDQTIDWALKNMNVDPKRIYIVGHSGGGYATFAMFMKSRHKIAGFSAWCGISDLVAWYEQSVMRKNRYGPDILLCTGSGDKLDVEKAKSRSPIYWKTPIKKRKKSFFQIHAGIHDGHTGSVPVSQSILFYNKMIQDFGNKDVSKAISKDDMALLLDEISPMPQVNEMLQDRKILYKKQYKNISYTIFEGGHEILKKAAIDHLNNQK